MESPSVNLYPLSGYSFSTNDYKIQKDSSVAHRLHRMKSKYLNEGMRTRVEGILLFGENRHPHVLLMQIGSTCWELPGGRLRPGENDIEGLKRKLCNRLGPRSSEHPDWQIGDCVAMWWRPDFDTLLYPCCPPHITKPKECRKLFLVHLSGREQFVMPKNLKLLAVPLFELHSDSKRYSVVVGSIPLQLSRFRFNLMPSSSGNSEEEHSEENVMPTS